MGNSGLTWTCLLVLVIVVKTIVATEDFEAVKSAEETQSDILSNYHEEYPQQREKPLRLCGKHFAMAASTLCEAGRVSRFVDASLIKPSPLSRAEILLDCCVKSCSLEQVVQFCTAP